MAEVWTDDWPPAEDQDGQDYEYLVKAWKAIRQREWALGSYIWPRCSNAYFTGTVSSIEADGDEYTLTAVQTDPEFDWTATGSHCGGSKRWTDYACDNLPASYPSSYDVIIAYDPIDPSKQVRAHITDNDVDTLQLTAVLDDYVVAKIIPSVASLAGKQMYIVAEGGIWWGDKTNSLMRWPDWPNDFEYAKGSVDSATTSSLTVSEPLWGKDKYIGYEVLVYDEDSILRRATITGNTGDTLSYAEQTWTATGAFIVVIANGVGFPGRKSGTPFLDYGGALESFYCHDPDDTVTGYPVIKLGELDFADSGNELDPCNCLIEDCSHNAFYQDVWSVETNWCGASDDPKTPAFYKSVSALQSELESLCVNFIEPLGYPVSGRNPKQPYTLALWFNAAGINNGTSSVIDKDGGGHYHASVDSKYNGYPVCYTILKGSHWKKQYRGIERDFGIATVVDGQIDLGTGLYNQDDEDANPGNDGIKSDVGEQVYWSAGWTRYYPKEFKYLYERTQFIPFYDSSEGGTGIKDPADVLDFEESGCDGVGQWIKRPVSTSYSEYDDNGYASEDGGDFQEGDYARHAGDRVIEPFAPETPVTDDPMPLDLPYWDKFYEGKHPIAMQATLERERLGTITEVLPGNYLRDDTKNWWSYWYSGGDGRVEEGTATSGSSTTLVDDSKTVANDPSKNCFWKTERFVNLGPWEGFILEVDKVQEDESVKTYRLPILSADPDTCTITFAAITGFTVAENDAYRIREPAYTLNRYATKELKIIRADGTDFTVTITNSDKDALYADFPEDLQVGWAYKIIEYYSGEVFQWTDGEWVIATGADARGGNDFHETPSENLPDYFTTYGFVAAGTGGLHKFDYASAPSDGEGVLAEIYRGINALVWTIKGIEWRSRANPAVSENNVLDDALSVGFESDFVEANWFEDTVDDPDNQVIDTSEGSATPGKYITNFAHQGYTNEDGTYFGAEVEIDLNAAYGYAWVDSIPTIISSEVDYFNFASLPSDADEFDVTTVVHSDSCTAADSNVANRNKKTFNAIGADVEYREWVLFDTSSTSNDSSRHSVALDDLDLPDLTDIANPPTSGHCSNDINEEQGWVVIDQTAIVRWDVEGGITYLE